MSSLTTTPPRQARKFDIKEILKMLFVAVHEKLQSCWSAVGDLHRVLHRTDCGGVSAGELRV